MVTLSVTVEDVSDGIASDIVSVLVTILSLGRDLVPVILIASVFCTVVVEIKVVVDVVFMDNGLDVVFMDNGLDVVVVVVAGVRFGEFDDLFGFFDEVVSLDFELDDLFAVSVVIGVEVGVIDVEFDDLFVEVVVTDVESDEELDEAVTSDEWGIVLVVSNNELFTVVAEVTVTVVELPVEV